MRLPDALLALGFERVEPGDGRSLDGLLTWVRGDLRVVFRGETLEVSDGRVWRYHATGCEVTLHKLEVAAGARRTGLASAFLGELVALADRLGLVVYLEPLPYEKNGGVSKEDLVRLYGLFGFAPTDETTKVMMRTPKNSQDKK